MKKLLIIISCCLLATDLCWSQEAALQPLANQNTEPIYSTFLSGFAVAASKAAVNYFALSAIQKEKTVVLQWQTAHEENNKCFYIQHFSKGQWKNIALVFSATEDGYSAHPIAYQYKDVPNKKIKNYRLMQVSTSGLVTYSQVITVQKH